MADRAKRPAGAVSEADILWPPTWQGLKQQIVYLAQFGSSIQIVHGEAGAGKTTFYDHLLRSGVGAPTVGVAAGNGVGLDAFFRSILTQLGLRPSPHAATGELISALRSFVQTLQKERSRLVLAVDDAHCLSDSELGALVSLLQGGTEAGIGLHMVLFAEPGFASRADALDVLDVTVHDAPLPPLSPSEVHNLLKLAGPRIGFKVDSPDQAQRIWNQSRGLPGKVLNLATKLQPTPTTEKVLSMRGLPVGHFAALILLSGILIWAFLVRTPDTSIRPEVAPTTLPAHAVPVNPRSPLGSEEVEPRPAKPQQAPDTPEIGTLSSTDEASASGAQIDEAVAAAAPGLDAELRGDFAGANIDVNENNRNAPDDASSDPAAPVDGDSDPQAIIGPQKPDAPTPKVAADMPQKPAAQVDLLSAGEQQLMRYPADGYVLQLMATGTVEKLQTYAAQQPNRKNLLLYRTIRDGKALYILVEGFYADKTSALAAVANLPDHQRKAGPWPKKIELIHKEIRENRAR